MDFDRPGRLESIAGSGGPPEARPEPVLPGEVCAGSVRSSPQPRPAGETHLPLWLVERIMNLLPAQDALLLAELLSQGSDPLWVCMTCDGWAVRPTGVHTTNRRQ